MHFPSLAQLIPVLQTAIGPTILISGVGLPLFIHDLNQSLAALKLELDAALTAPDEQHAAPLGTGHTDTL